MIKLYNTSNIFKKHRILFLLFIFLSPVLGWGQTEYAGAASCTSGASTAWLTAANWCGGSIPSTTGYGQFTTKCSGTTIGINMNGSTNNGTNNQAIGAIEIASGGNARIINNSSGTVAGTLTLNGTTVNSVSNVVLRNNSSSLLTLTNGASFNMGVALGNSTNNIINIDGSGGITIGSIISGASKNLTKTGSGAGILTLTAVNTYTGTTTISAGELRLNPSGNLNLSGACTFNGGALSATGITTTRTITFSSINISDNSTLQLLASTNHTITFAAKGTFTSSKILTIKGWTGSYVLGTTGAVTAAGKVFIGNSASLTAAELLQIQFFDGTNTYFATQLSTGEIIPTTKLVVSSISSQTAGVGFAVTVTSTDVSGTARNLTNATGITLTSNGNAGSIGGTTTGSISASGNNVTISGVTLPSAGTGVTITATRSSGDQPLAGTSGTFTVASATPTITGAATATAFATTYGTASSVQSFSVSGSSLTANLVATAPTGFEVSSDGTTYGSTATFTQSSGSASGTLRIRLSTTATVGGTYNSQNIALSSTGATSVNITTSASGNAVSAKALTITGLTGDNRVYDATSTATTSGTAALSGVINSDVVNLGGSPTLNFANKNIGTGKSITVTGYSISGAGAGNYTLTQPSPTANITVATLTTSGVSASNKVYDATTAATTTGGSFSGVLGSDAVTLTHNAGTFSQATVGTGIGVTPNITSTGTDGANYTVTQPSGLTANITQKSLTITGLTANNKAYDATATATLSGTAALSGVIAADVSNVTLGGTPVANFNDATVGTGKLVTVTGYSISGSASANYSLSQPTGLTADITSTPVPVINSSLTQSATYGTTATTYTITATNSPTSFNATGLPTGLSVNTSTGDITGTPTANIGNYNVSITATNAGGTSVAATLVYTISAKTLTISSAAATSKVYDRTNAATITGTLSGIYGGDVVTFSGTGTFAQITVGTSIVVTSTATLGGAGAGNYNLTQPIGLTADITAKALTVSGSTVTSKTYTGTNPATITGATLVGIISPDDVTVSGGGTFASVNVGTGISVTTTLTLGGANAGNYSITQPTGLTGNITTAALTITGLTGNNKTYDATTSASLSGIPAYSGLQNGETFSVSGTVSATFATKTVGTTKAITVTGYTAPSSNYSISQPTGLTGNITVASLTISSPGVNNKTYTGTNTATLTGTLSGVLGSDAVTLNLSGTFASVNAATGISVTSTSSLSGTDAGNYTLTQPTGLTANITQVALTATADDKSKNQGAANPSLTISYSGFVNSETVAVITAPSISTTAVTGSPVGTYPISLSGGSATNYSISLVNGTLTVSVPTVSIVTFDFAGIAGSETTSGSNYNDANIGASTISRGAGLTSSANADRFNAVNWDATSIASAVSGNNYMEFTITPNSGYQFTVSSVAINLQRSASGPSAVALRSSVNSYASDLDAVKTIVDNTSTQTFTFTFSQSNSNIPVTYRFYMYAEATGGSGGIGDGTGDDITVLGTVTTSCTGPTQAASLSSNTPTTDGFSAAWTAGAGNGTMVVVRPTAQSISQPNSGTSYTANLAWTSAGQINTNNRVVFRTSGSSAGPVTGLSAETQYTATAYEYNTSGDCYNTASAPSVSVYTLSVEPTAHSSSFNSSAFSYNQINLTFSAASSISNADGYIILQRASAAPTGLPSDASSYSVGNTIGDATVAAIITSTATTTASITGLSATTQYYYTMIPYNYDGTNAATYNYRTAATIPGTNATTLVQPSTSSDIIANAAYTYNSNINYSTYQIATITNTSNSIDLFKFDLRDGGGSADADALPTILTDITFNVTNLSNIRTAALFNGNALVNAAPAINTGAGTIAFAGLSGANVTAADGGINSLTLRVSFNSSVTDNAQFQITIAAANCTAAGTSTSSLFSSFTSVVSSTTSNRNRIVVTATTIAFGTPPSGGGINTNLPSFTINAVDANGNTDLDQSTCTVALTTSGTGFSSASPYTFSSGVIAVSTAQFSSIQTATITATAQSCLGSTAIASGSLSITGIVYVANDYQSNTGTGMVWGTAANWRKHNGSGWNAYGADGTPSAVRRVYIQGDMATNGSRTADEMIVMSGGYLTIDASSTATTKMKVLTGGTLMVTASLTNSGTFEVEDNADVFLAFAFSNPSTSIWAGTENFAANSNLYIWDWKVTSSSNMPLINANLTTNTYSGYPAAFGNVVIDLAGSSVADDWEMIGTSFGTTNLCHGNFEIASPNGFDIKFLATAGASATIGIQGNFLMSSNWSSARTVLLGTSTSTVVLNVKGNFEMDCAGDFTVRGSNSNGGSSTLNIDGNLLINGSNTTTNTNFKLNQNSYGTANARYAIVNLKGNLTVGANPTITNLAPVSDVQFNFTGTTTQLLNVASNATGGSSTGVPFAIKSGATVRLSTNNFVLNNASTFTVENGGTLDFGFAANGTTPLLITQLGSPTGSNLFASNQGSTLKITSPDGITTTASLGNVQVAASNRTFNQVATFWYIGNVNQVTGNAITSGSSAKVLICDLADNTKQLSLSNSTTFSSTTTISATYGGHLYIKKGQFIESTTAYITSAGGTLRMDGGTLYYVAKGSSSAATAFTNTELIPRLTSAINTATGDYYLNGGTIELGGTGSSEVFQVLRGAGRIYKNVKYSGPNTLGTDYKSLSSNAVIDSALIITNGAVLDMIDVSSNPVSFTGNGGITMSGANSRLRMKNLNLTLPELLGVATTYSLTGGTVELYGTSSSQTHSLRGTANSANITYNNIELNSTATNLTNGSANIVAQAGFNLKGTMNVNSPTCFQLGSGFNIIDSGTSSSTFDVKSGATFKYGGTINSSGATGNIRTTTRTFSTTASYGFIGSVTPQTAGTALPVTMRNMYMEKTASTNTVTLSNPTTVTADLWLTLGKLTTSSTNYLNMDVDALVQAVSDNSFVNGPVRKTGKVRFLFPTGKGSTYRPVEIIPPTPFSNLLTDHYTAEYFDSNPQSTYVVDSTNQAYTLSPMLYLSNREYWDVSRTGGTSSVYITLYWTNYGSGYITNLNKLRVAHWRTTGTPYAPYWENMGNSLTTGSTTTGSVKSATPFSTFSPVALGSEGEDNPLPIELISFKAKAENQHVKVEWTTVSEVNNDFFTVEKTIDGKNFEEVVREKAEGFSNSYKLYTATDESPYIGTSYYRLKQTDFDGESEFSNLEAVSFSGNGKPSFTSVSTLDNTVSIHNLIKGGYKVSIMDLSGKVIFTDFISTESGATKTFDIPQISKGVYLLHIDNGVQVENKKIVF